MFATIDDEATLMGWKWVRQDSNSKVDDKPLPLPEIQDKLKCYLQARMIVLFIIIIF